MANMEEPVRETDRHTNTLTHAHTDTQGSDIPNYCNEGAADRAAYLMMPYCSRRLPHSYFQKLAVNYDHGDLSFLFI